MPAFNFKAQFAGPVERGEKRQTIRPKRKRPTKPGDAAHLYTGMRTKACRRLRPVETVLSVHPVLLTSAGAAVDNRLLSDEEQIALARADGFATEEAFLGFFRQTYGLPFEGELIKW